MAKPLKRLADSYRQTPLAYRLAIGVYLLALITMVAGTTAFLIREYQHAIDEAEQQLHRLQLTSAPGLTHALWDFDEEQLQVQLRALSQLPEIDAVQVRWQDWNGQSRSLIAGERSAGVQQWQEFPLVYRRHSGTPEPLGMLQIRLSTSEIYQRTWERSVFAIGLLSALILALAIAFHLLVTYLFRARLAALAQYSRRLSIENLHKPFVSDRRYLQPDELDDVISAINRLREELIQHIRDQQQLEEKLREKQRSHDEDH